MGLVSVVVVSSFKAVGAVLVVATLILPGATAYLLSSRLPVMLLLSVVHAAVSAVLGMHLGVWLNCSFGAAVVVIGGVLFCMAWAGILAARMIARGSARKMGATETEKLNLPGA
jgi:manganese/zinc/iron transport system permease protein